MLSGRLVIPISCTFDQCYKKIFFTCESIGITAALPSLLPLHSYIRYTCSLVPNHHLCFITYYCYCLNWLMQTLQSLFNNVTRAFCLAVGDSAAPPLLSPYNENITWNKTKNAFTKRGLLQMNF